jgi:hypothetical protein
MQNQELSPIAQRALRGIRALRQLPDAPSVVAAERKILSKLNCDDTLAVALELVEDNEEAAQ